MATVSPRTMRSCASMPELVAFVEGYGLDSGAGSMERVARIPRIAAIRLDLFDGYHWKGIALK
jgi:hypothetical protein